MQYEAPICLDCKHYHNGDLGFSCKAYPEGIPKEIMTGEIDHKKPYKNDNGIQFEKKELEE